MSVQRTVPTMAPASHHDASPPWYRQRWPWLLMLGPAVVLVAGVITLWLAIASDDGLVADDHYRRGLEINRTLERVARAEALGLRAQVTIGPEGAVAVALSGRSAEADARPAAVSLILSHATRAGADVTGTLTLAPDGGYRGRIELPARGRWRVSVETRAWRLASAEVDGPVMTVELPGREGR